MKFRFCGDLDCPDWVLAEIATISKISSIKAKQLCTLVANSVVSEEVIKLERIEKFANDSKLVLNDIKACISLIEFILTSGAKNQVVGDVLSSELQQLGMPKEHSTSLCRVYNEKYADLDLMLKNNSLKLNTLEDLHWRVDYIFGSSHLERVNRPLANLNLYIKNCCSNQIESHMVSLDSKRLNLLINEMKEVRKMIENLEETNVSKMSTA